MSVLNDDDKKILRMLCKVLESFGENGTITIDYYDLETSYENPIFRRISNDSFSISKLKNPPVEVINVFYKVAKHIDKNIKDIANEIEEANDYFNFEFLLDIENKELTADLLYYYMVEEDSNTIDLLDEDTEELLNNLSERYPYEDKLVLGYSGGGDSGFLNNEFDNGELVSSEIEDFCYGELENNFGGWEINEGSQGFFEFILRGEDKGMFLVHTYNVEKTGAETVFQEKF